MLFKPSAAKVAKRIYEIAPSMAGTVMAAVRMDYEPVVVRFGETAALGSVLIDITSEALIRGIAPVRGERFAHKVGSEYAKLTPTLGALAGICAHAVGAGLSQERGMAEAVLSQSEHLDDAHAVAELEQFITAFRKAALEVAASSVLNSKVEAHSMQ